MSIVIPIHLLAALIWVGGMFFAYMVLRPTAASQLEPSQRLTLWVGVFQRFFVWVWPAVILLPVTGYWMIFVVYQGMGNTPLFVHVMNGIGTVMILIYLHVFFAPYKRLKNAVITEDWPTGAKQLAQIRVMVGINVVLGLVTVVLASAGRYI
jgi:uncharacterized membrane protein